MKTGFEERGRENITMSTIPLSEALEIKSAGRGDNASPAVLKLIASIEELRKGESALVYDCELKIDAKKVHANICSYVKNHHLGKEFRISVRKNNVLVYKRPELPVDEDRLKKIDEDRLKKREQTNKTIEERGNDYTNRG